MASDCLLQRWLQRQKGFPAGLGSRSVSEHRSDPLSCQGLLSVMNVRLNELRRTATQRHRSTRADQSTPQDRFGGFSAVRGVASGATPSLVLQPRWEGGLSCW
ncbi:unnamed protein product [Boreogadus saida]